jgi:hypothetical protein
MNLGSAVERSAPMPLAGAADEAFAFMDPPGSAGIRYVVHDRYMKVAQTTAG